MRYVINKKNFNDEGKVLEFICSRCDWDCFEWHDFWGIHVPENDQKYFEFLFGEFL